METFLVLIIFAGWTYFYLFNTKVKEMNTVPIQKQNQKLIREVIIYPSLGYIIDRRFE